MRFSAKLLFQFRVLGEAAVRRLCEERIIMFDSQTTATALRHSKRYGKKAEYQYQNDGGNDVRFEFVGVMDLLGLGSECGEEEVWYEIRERIRPMERSRKWIPSDKTLIQGPVKTVRKQS